MNIVIIGNGAAGVTAAETIRKEDTRSSLTIVSDEAHPYYSRPRLMELMAPAAQAGQLVIHPREWYAERTIDLRLGVTITRIDTAAKALRDASASICL